MAAQKVSSPKAGADRKVVPVMAPDEAVHVPEMHVLAVDDSVVDRAVIAKILRSSKYRGKSPCPHPIQPCSAVLAEISRQFFPGCKFLTVPCSSLQ
jgi:hypothetical protein